MSGVEDFVLDFIVEFVSEYMRRKDIHTEWRKPLVAFANAKDSMFLDLKRIIGSSHALPTDFLEDAKTVICYFLPFKEWIVKSNIGGEYASKEWALAYVETNRLIIEINEALARELERMGFKSAVLPPTHNFDEEKLISDWSHRHVAYIAGLGTFGLNRMIITESGCCGRIGSLVTNAEIKPTEKPETEYCLYKRDGSCVKCVEKCTFNALKLDSFDRHKCYNVCLKNAEKYEDLGLADVCGKCLCGIPCSLKIP